MENKLDELVHLPLSAYGRWNAFKRRLGRCGRKKCTKHFSDQNVSQTEDRWPRDASVSSHGRDRQSHRLDSNQRPVLYESTALPTELRWRRAGYCLDPGGMCQFAGAQPRDGSNLPLPASVYDRAWYSFLRSKVAVRRQVGDPSPGTDREFDYVIAFITPRFACIPRRSPHSGLPGDPRFATHPAIGPIRILSLRRTA